MGANQGNIKNHTHEQGLVTVSKTGETETEICVYSKIKTGNKDASVQHILQKSTLEKTFVILLILIVICLTVTVILIGLSHFIFGSAFGLLGNCVNPPSPSNTTTLAPTITNNSIVTLESRKLIYAKIQDHPNFKLFPQLSECGHPATAQLLRQMEIQKRSKSNIINSIPALVAAPAPVPALTPAPLLRKTRKRRVVGGQEIRDKSFFPWMVQIYVGGYRSNGAAFVCGGTLITKRYVLTSAHCVYHRIVNSVKLNNKEGTVINVEKIISHPKYEEQLVNLKNEYTTFVQNDDLDWNSNMNSARSNAGGGENEKQELFLRQKLNPHRPFDIALIRLETEVDTSTQYSPVCLPFRRYYNLTKTSIDYKTHTLFSAGWGYSNPHSRAASEHINYISLPLVRNTYCQSVFWNDTKITSKMICAGGTKGEVVCGGDSGGPLFLDVTGRSFQVGVTSFGKEDSNNCDVGAPSVFIEVFSYVKWILDSVEP